MAAHTFDFDPLMTQGWVSFQPSHPLDVVGYWVRANLPITCKSDYRQDCRQNLKRFWDAPDRNSYIEGLPIPCHSLPSLVQTAGSDLRDLSMLVVDAEGLDTKILAATAEREDFLPGFIMWEVGNSKEERVILPELQRVLRRKGYTVGIKTGANTTIKGHGGNFKTGDAANMIAVLERPLAHLMGR
uniref:Methyltransferase FkbM domain-containing protein n=1 Tax=Alexandrium andersonii TaxID=327968 RepID=A0A7S2NCJ9_9DINO